ncbi:lysine N(6)-hydroxylase/L-ornithine N(5)-oxygenase family protein [Streptomyces sp. NPDC048590]|uniref:lysine N(6)-hydroxylase/L-ornithine N(5)-oxygenase family protein n=1 Tax=Streptomyces sp. NPDC048590 TaxID=3365574 RepID=UPI00370F8B97
MSAGHADAELYDQQPVHDVVGVGFGPANLALAIAIAEHNAHSGGARALRTAFVERQREFGWHRGMLLAGATMQVSFLKDLATMRDPSSRFTFLRFLHERGRLVDFLNQKTFFPTRIEFHEYLSWCAAAVNDQVRYGRQAHSVRPAGGSGPVDVLEVGSTPTGDLTGPVETLRTRNLVVGTGLAPKLPEGVELGPRVWHNRDLLPSHRSLATRPHRRFAVIGAGQSAAETVDFLHREFPDAEVCAVFNRYGYSPADDSPFANRIFDPEAVDHFYAAPEEVKQSLLTYHSNTNYSVVDPDLIEQLYRTSYQEKIAGAERLRFLNTTSLTAVEEREDDVRLHLRPLVEGDPYTLDCDAVVMATGFRPADPRNLLGDLYEECLTDGQGRLRIGRDHRVLTTPRVSAGIFVQGAIAQHTHGITSSLLSTLAVRSGEICDALLLDRAGRKVPVPAAAVDTAENLAAATD